MSLKDNELERRRKLSDQMRQLITEQIDDHENSFDNENIRDFVDLYWRTVKHGSESEKKFITSIKSLTTLYMRKLSRLK